MRKYLFFVLIILVVLAACTSRIDQNKAKSNINVCIDCGPDSISAIWDKTQNAGDTLFALMASIDNFGGAPRDLEYKIQLIDELIQINKRLRLIDISPYKLYQDGIQFWIQNDERKSIDKIIEAIEVFDSQKKIMGDASILNGLRLYFSTAGLREERFTYYKEKLKYYEENGPFENIATCFHAIAGSYTFNADYNNAISYYLKAAEIYKKYSPNGYSNEINAVGRYYYYWGNYDRAIEYTNQSIQICGILKRWMNVGEGEIILAKIHKKRKDYQAALNSLDHVLSLSDTLNDFQLKAIGLTEKAGILLEMNKTEDAYAYLKEAQHIRDSLSFPISTNNGELEVNFYLYKYYTQTRNITMAEAELKEAFRRAKLKKDDGLVQKYRYELASFYEFNGNSKEAAVVAFRYINFGDSLQANFNSANIAGFENEQKEIKRNLEIQQLQNQKKAQQNYFLLGGIFLLLISIGIYSRFRFIRRVRKQLEEKNKMIEKEKLLTEQSLEDLKAAQAQLIHSEKMASLGELTAGIAHEIQNPLNFIKNFSEVNAELIGELKEEIDKGDLEEIKAIATDIEENEVKVIHHGKRADAIVKGMLQHSRSSSDEKELTNINELADEYLRLAYHGLRAKDKSFVADFKTNLDENLPKIYVVPQDIGRVLLNLINNAFFAVNERLKKGEEGYKPIVSVTTFEENKKVVIKVTDNGSGIPDHVLDKIFQPFFTTKPTGEGTGLGLSMSYDIITKGHGGNISVETKEHEGTVFLIQIPINLNKI